MRFGNNLMDKLDLPLPDEEGPSTYRNTVLLFERLRPGEFQLRVGTPREISRWRSASRRAGTGYSMRGGRQYGVF
jgi:hypothetical protein